MGAGAVYIPLSHVPLEKILDGVDWCSGSWEVGSQLVWQPTVSRAEHSPTVAQPDAPSE